MITGHPRFHVFAERNGRRMTFAYTTVEELTRNILRLRSQGWTVESDHYTELPIHAQRREGAMS